jgi:hypothetical protein
VSSLSRSLEDYPPISYPGGIPDPPAARWSEKQARRYFDWFISVFEQRLRILSAFLGIPLAGDAVEILSEAGKRLLEIIPIAMNNASPEVLPPYEQALAADMGLLLAKSWLENSNGRLRWEIDLKPKNSATHNLPVLVGWRVPEMRCNPVLVGTNIYFKVKHGDEGADEWVRIYRTWMELLQV